MKSVFLLILSSFLMLGTLTAQASVNFGSDLNIVNLSPVAAVTASGDSSAVDMLLYDGQCAGLFDVSAPVSGTTPGLAVKLTHSSTSGGSYTDVTGGGFSAVADAAVSEKIVFNKNNLKRYVKLNRVISGTSSPQYLMSVKLACQKKYR